MLGSTLAHDWSGLQATSCRKFWSYTTQLGHLYFKLALATMPWYAISSGILFGLCGPTVATYNAKHCIQVARSGMIFLDCMRSAAWTTKTCPSRAWGTALAFPLAGGSSAKSTYSPASIFSTSLFGSAARPAPAGTRVVTVSSLSIAFPSFSSASIVGSAPFPPVTSPAFPFPFPCTLTPPRSKSLAAGSLPRPSIPACR